MLDNATTAIVVHADDRKKSIVDIGQRKIQGEVDQGIFSIIRLRSVKSVTAQRGRQIYRNSTKLENGYALYWLPIGICSLYAARLCRQPL